MKLSEAQHRQANIKCLSLDEMMACLRVLYPNGVLPNNTYITLYADGSIGANQFDYERKSEKYPTLPATDFIASNPLP